MSKEKEIKRFANITEQNIKKLGVQALADRPNVAGKYGQSGLSPAELKAWFDNLAKFIANKINTVQDTLATDEIAQYIKVALEEYDIEHLQDLIDSVMDGRFAEHLLMILPTQTSTERMALQSVIFGINKNIADRIAEAYEEIGAVRKLVKDLGYGYTGADANFVEDGGEVGVDVEVVDDNEGKKLIFTLKNFGKGAVEAALSFPINGGDATYSLEQKAPLTKKNKVLSQSSVGFGENCVSGCKGYYISEIYYGDSSNNPQIRVATSMPVLSGLKISSSKLTATSSFTAPNYANGDEFSITCGSHYFHIGTISSINKDVITFTGDVEVLKSGFNTSANSNNGYLTSTSFRVLIPGIDDYTMCVPSKPTVGIASVSALTFTEGSDNIAAGIMSSSRGRENISGGAYSDTSGRENIAGYCADASGRGTKALGKYSHSQNKDTTAEGYASTAMGENTVASGEGAIAKGKGTKARGDFSETGGYQTEADGMYSTASNYMCKAVSKFSNARGQGTTAGSKGVDANGKAFENAAAEAMGCETEATGKFSLAHGYRTKATNSNTDAGGNSTEASGKNSATRGLGTKATADNQMVVGTYNAENPDALFIVGNGTTNAKRSNAFEVLKDGRIIGATQVAGGGASYIRMDENVENSLFRAEIITDFKPRFCLRTNAPRKTYDDSYLYMSFYVNSKDNGDGTYTNEFNFIATDRPDLYKYFDFVYLLFG